MTTKDTAATWNRAKRLTVIVFTVSSLGYTADSLQRRKQQGQQRYAYSPVVENQWLKRSLLIENRNPPSG
jgi:hypothetical protein